MTMALLRLGLVEPVLFGAGMATMTSLAAQLLVGGPNTVVLAQVEAVLAAGEQSSDVASPHVTQERAGGTTWFGPGVLLVAPVALAEARMLHEALLRAAADVCAARGVETVRRTLHPGLWVRDDQGWRKIASIGLGGNGPFVYGGGGLALNVCPDLAVFDEFDACGIGGVRMTSLAAETGGTLTVAAVADQMAAALERHVAPVLLQRAETAAS